jgi:hypothetical protein
MATLCGDSQAKTVTALSSSLPRDMWNGSHGVSTDSATAKAKRRVAEHLLDRLAGYGPADVPQHQPDGAADGDLLREPPPRTRTRQWPCRCRGHAVPTR